MGADELKAVEAVADALRSVVLLTIVVVLVTLAVIYRKEIGRKIDSLTEFSYGGAKLTFEARVELLRRSLRSGIDVKDRPLKVAVCRAEKHQGDLQGMRTLWVNNHPSDDWYLRDLLENFGVRSDVARDTKAALARLEETRYDVVISDEYRGGNPEGLALVQQMAELAQRLERDGGFGPVLSDVPVIIYGSNSSRPPPPGVKLMTNRSDEVLQQIVDVALIQASRVRGGAIK